MMSIADPARYQRYRENRGHTRTCFLQDLLLPMLLFGSMGAITWAIRGTDGWGGIDGTLVPGLTWGLLWYYLYARKGIDARGVVLWLGLGIALGGELGYGQYVAWIQGQFHTGGEVIPVAPWVGYAWFVLCGIGWGAPGGILLGWALHPHVSGRAWLVRVCLVLALLVVIFNLPLTFAGEGAVSRLGGWLAHAAPALLFPLAELGIYGEGMDGHQARTVYTNTQNFAVVVWWMAALGVALAQRDRATLVSGLVIGGGFGIGFVVSALWCLGYTYAPAYIDWWKLWELHAGFNLGLLYVLVGYWAARQRGEAGPSQAQPATPHALTTPFLAAAGFVLIFAAGVEYFYWTGLFLASFFALAMGAAALQGPRRAVELRKRVSLTYAAFLLVFMLLHGGVSRTGVFLGLYPVEAVDQYAWPVARMALFVPVAAVVTGATVLSLVRQFRVPEAPGMPMWRLHERLIDLCAFTGLVGAVTIWPEKIGVLYVLFLCMALYALTRLARPVSGGSSP